MLYITQICLSGVGIENVEIQHLTSYLTSRHFCHMDDLAILTPDVAPRRVRLMQHVILSNVTWFDSNQWRRISILVRLVINDRYSHPTGDNRWYAPPGYYPWSVRVRSTCLCQFLIFFLRSNLRREISPGMLCLWFLQPYTSRTCYVRLLRWLLFR